MSAEQHGLRETHLPVTTRSAVQCPHAREPLRHVGPVPAAARHPSKAAPL